jgi:16S rRNA G527 N7-methylase RsmG
VWALLEPEWEFLLVERRHKKAAFLERMAAVLGLDDVEVFAGDAQEAGTITRFVRRFDAATAMAVGPAEKTAGLVEPFLRSGRVFATTVPRDEPAPPANVGGSLVLLEADSDAESVYAIYQKG